MFNSRINNALRQCQAELHEAQATLEALGRSMAIIEFQPDGTILTANPNFLATTGYELEEIRGRNHRIFCEPDYAESREYVEFWRRLASGEFLRDRFVRLNKHGEEIWLEASYNPVKTTTGEVLKVVKILIEIREGTRQVVDIISQSSALSR